MRIIKMENGTEVIMMGDEPRPSRPGGPVPFADMITTANIEQVKAKRAAEKEAAEKLAAEREAAKNEK